MQQVADRSGQVQNFAENLRKLKLINCLQ